MTRIHRIIAAVVVLGVASGVAAWCWRSARRPGDAVARARVHLEKGDPELALRSIRPLLDAGHRDVELCLLAARAYRQLAEPTKALQYLDAVAASGFESDEASLERGLALAALGRFSEAEPLLMASPTKEAAAARVSLHLSLFEMNEALEELEGWKRLDPADSVPHLLAGAIWMDRRQRDKAVAEFRRAAELRPEDYEVRLQLAHALVEIGEAMEAAELLRACLAERPAAAEPALRLAICEVRLGDSASARARLEELIRQHPHATEGLVELAKLEMEDGNAERAEQLLTDAVSSDPTHDAAALELSHALSRLGKAEQAAQQQQRAEQLQELRRRFFDAMDRVYDDRTDLDARCEAGELLEELGAPQQAARLFAAVLSRDPQHTRALDAMKRLN